MNVQKPLTLTLTAIALAALSACSSVPDGDTVVGPSSVPPRIAALVPYFGGNADVLDSLSNQELQHLRLVTTNLVTTLVQIPELRPDNATLQYSDPQTAFGNAVVRALEDAGFGMQRVSADQGINYVSYEDGQAQTDIGPVTRYVVSIGKIRVSREYDVINGAIFPSSLMTINGSSFAGDIELADDIFKEQGADIDSAFISGVQYPDNPDPGLTVETIEVHDYDALPVNKRQQPETVLNEARQRFFRLDAERSAPNLDQFRRFRRTVLIFNDADTRMMGEGNKQAVRLLVREFNPGDLIMIKACQDIDGQDQASLERAIRVEEELASYQLAPESTWIAPCTRASFRHTSDNSPAPVEIIHYKQR